MVIDQTIGFVAHLRLNAILKGERGTEFELVAVELAEGHELAETLHRLVSADLSHAFEIASLLSSAEVEAPAGDVGSRAASPATLGEFLDTREVTGATLDADDHATIVDTIRAHRDGASPATLDELRAKVRGWSPKDRAELTAYFERNDTDTADAAQVAEAIDAVENFRTTTTTPAPRTVPADAPEQPMKRDIDEGAEVDAATVQAAGKRYAALPDVVRSWVSMCGGNIRLTGDTGKPTERRATLLWALCELAEHELDNDDAALAIAAHCGLGDEAWQGAPVAETVAALSVAEAHQFAAVASLVCMALEPFEFPEGRVRCVLTSELAAAA